MNIKDLIKWCYQHKLWFVISFFVCLGAGVLYYLHTPKKYTISASIMLRSTDVSSQRGEVMEMLGVESEKNTQDEIQILTSRDLMEQIVSTLHLAARVEKKEGLRWVPVYPCPDFALNMESPATKVQTHKQVMEGVKYRIVLTPHEIAVDNFLKHLSVTRLGRESQIITISIESDCPQQAIDMLNLLLSLYNTTADTDKRDVAQIAQSFLNDRVDALSRELNDAEVKVELYKSLNRITDIDKTAREYQEQVETYQKQLVDLDFEMLKLNNLDSQLQEVKKINNPYVILSDVNNASLQSLLGAYNAAVQSKMNLMNEALENNPMVQVKDKTIGNYYQDLVTCLKDVKEATQRQRSHIQTQHDRYASLLANLPEQERAYVELLREKNTKEQQYVYLIQRQEENALLLASSSVSAKIVEHPKKAAKVASPRMSRVGLVVLLFTFLMPMLVYFGGIVKKDLE